MGCAGVFSRRTRPLFGVASLLALLSLSSPRPAAAQDPPTPSPAEAVNQLLRPGDVVRLKIWREPDLSGDYDVNEQGVAVFPKIGPLPVGRLATDSVRSFLVATYTRFLQEPSVEVTFLRRINVLGWVRNPGLYHVDATMTLADVLAMAGGVTSDGNVKKIALYRGGERVPGALSEQSLLADLPLHSGDQLRVPQKSWMSRNSATVIAASISGVALVAAALIRF
jgi:protein involved in polysaccharide export with SLBB domain